MEKKYDVLVAGYLCIDLIPGFKKNGRTLPLPEILQPGKLIEIDGMDFFPGGIVANTGLALKKFGKKVYLNGLAGNDFIGNILTDYLDQFDLREGISVTDKAGTAFGIVIAPPGTDRIFLESPGCSHLFSEHNIDMEKAALSHIFHFGYPPLLREFYIDQGEKLSNVFQQLKYNNVITSLDFSLPDLQSESGRINWKQFLMGVLPFTDIFMPSLEEIVQVMRPDFLQEINLADTPDLVELIPAEMIREIADELLQMGVNILMIKAAHRGIYLVTSKDAGNNLSKATEAHYGEAWNNCEFWCKAYPADPLLIKNASGAGDTTAAAFLAAFLDREAPELAVRYAAMAGRNNLYCDLGLDHLSGWSEMTAALKEEHTDIHHYI